MSRAPWLLALLCALGCPDPGLPDDDDDTVDDDDDSTGDDDDSGDDDDTGDDDDDTTTSCAGEEALLAMLESLQALPGAARAEALSEGLASLALDHPLPIACPGDGTTRYLLVASLESGFSAVSGDFDGWSGSAPLTPLACCAEVGWAEFQVDDPSATPHYKLMRGADLVADPHATRYRYDEFGEVSLLRGDARSHLERVSGRAFFGTTTRDLILYLPPGHELNGGGPLPRVVAHDGQNLFDPEAFFGGWRARAGFDAAIANGAPPFLAVGIPNGPDRFEAYTHTPDDLGDGPLGGEADAYLDLIVDDILPTVARRHPPLDDTAALLGSSLGGLVSCYGGLTRPEVFPSVACLSSTFGWGRIGASASGTPFVDLVRSTPYQPQRWYLDSGGGTNGACDQDTDGDGVWDDADDDDNYCETLQVRDALEAAGWSFSSGELSHWWEPGAGHNEAAWADRVEQAVTALLR